MLSPIELQQRWGDRHKYIHVMDIPLDKKELNYIVNVLYIFNSRFKKYQIVLSDRTVLESSLEGVKKGKTAYKVADELTKTNNIILSEL